MRREEPLLTLECNLQWPSRFSRGRCASDSLFIPHIYWLYDAIAHRHFSAQLPARSPHEGHYRLRPTHPNSARWLHRRLFQACVGPQDVVLAKPAMAYPPLDIEPPAGSGKSEGTDAGSRGVPNLPRTSLHDSVTSSERESPFLRVSLDHSGSKR
jgi:hypothetical protein